MGIRTILFVVWCILLYGCATLTVHPVDFSWPVEVVVKPDVNGVVQVPRYQLRFSLKPLLFEEFRDSTVVPEMAMNLIRDARGYYFITAKGFTHVYVFSVGDECLKLEKKIKVSDVPLVAPAFNQRAPYIEFVDEKNSAILPLYLTREGIKEGGKQ